ncbi:MAG: MerR family transcriptional regulator [Gemmatimonadaceae bacterium]|nr:MerR family transcriptional regulator [Gemmatimonadaceae bacterium]
MPSRRPAADPRTTPVHPIQVVTRRTGLSADVLRVWEKRYGAVTPARTTSARRLYSEADIERLILLAEATLTGHGIGQVATWSTEALTTLVREARVRTAPGPVAAVHGAMDAHASTDHVPACLAAIAAFDAVALELALRRASVALAAATFFDRVVVPLVDALAERAQDGTLTAAHRHLALAVLRAVLAQLALAATAPVSTQRLVVATPVGHPHELAALLVAATAAAEGWHVLHLGPDVPAAAVAEAAAHGHASAVVLGFAGAPGDRATPRELRALRRALPPAVALLVHGAGIARHRQVLDEVGASAHADLASLRTQLRTLRT